MLVKYLKVGTRTISKIWKFQIDKHGLLFAHTKIKTHIVILKTIT